ncbi:hypothetical protein [Myxococcus fulvus]
MLGCVCARVPQERAEGTTFSSRRGVGNQGLGVTFEVRGLFRCDPRLT